MPGKKLRLNMPKQANGDLLVDKGVSQLFPLALLIRNQHLLAEIVAHQDGTIFETLEGRCFDLAAIDQ